MRNSPFTTSSYYNLNKKLIYYTIALIYREVIVKVYIFHSILRFSQGPLSSDRLVAVFAFDDDFFS